MEPSIVYASVETPAVIKGRRFYDFARVHLNDHQPTILDRGWNVWVDDVHLEAGQTVRIDANSLRIVFPLGLPLGTHDLSVTDPRGQSRTLTHAFSVVTDSNTSNPNATGGATTNPSGGTSSRNDGGSSSNTLGSRGGTGAMGGIASAVGGSTAASMGGGTISVGGTASLAGGSDTRSSIGSTSTSAAGESSATSAGGATMGVGGTAGLTGGSNTLASRGGTEAVGGIVNTAGSGGYASSMSGGTPATGGSMGQGGTCTQNCPAACPNGTCDPGESPCSCPADCLPPSCGDAGFPQLCDANDSSLVACYRFESSVQPGEDDSQYGNHATVKNASLVAGHDGRAISLGASSQVEVANSSSLDILYMTVEMWIYADRAPTGTRAGLLDCEGQYGLFLLKSGALWCSVTTPAGNSAAETTAAVNLREWTHVACTCDGGNVKIFINGVEQASVSSSDVISTAGTTGVSIGADNPSGDNLVGLLDDLRIWKVAHTTDQICQAAHACTP